MTPFKTEKFLNAFLGFVCVAFALALQIQVTLFQSPDYLGLRLSLADLLLLPAALITATLLLMRTAQWPHWPMKGPYLWIAGLSLVLIAAFAHTYFVYGEISRWALVNKVFGWFVLMGLFSLGGWIATNAQEKHIACFFRTLISFATVVLVIQAIAMMFSLHPSLPGAWLFLDIKYPIDGLMANRNAYAFFFLAVFAFTTIDALSLRNILPRGLVNFLYFLLPFFIVFNGSRATVLTLALMLPVIFVLRRRHWRRMATLLLAALIGASVLAVASHDRTNKLSIFHERYFEIFGEVASTEKVPSIDKMQESVAYVGDKQRLVILGDAMDMVRKNPFFGSGLGSAMLEQKAEHGKTINLIDCTPLWLLVETGLVGLLIFAAFFLKVVSTLIRQLKYDDVFAANIRLSILMVILGFSVMCLLHELTYARHLWFLLGMALCLPSKTRPAV